MNYIISAREPVHGRRGLLRTSGGTIKGLSLSFVTWIRDDWQPSLCGMPDMDNDKVQGSFVVRDSPKKPIKASTG